MGKETANVQELIVNLKAFTNILRAKIAEINELINSLDVLFEENEDFIQTIKSEQQTRKTQRKNQ